MDELKQAMNTVRLLSKIFQYLENNPSVLADIFADDKKKDTNKTANEKAIEIDIYDIYRRRGKDGLENALEDLSINELKEIVNKHRLDPKKYFYKWKTKEKFIAFISEKVESKAEKGKVFFSEDMDSNKTHTD